MAEEKKAQNTPPAPLKPLNEDKGLPPVQRSRPMPPVKPPKKNS